MFCRLGFNILPTTWWRGGGGGGGGCSTAGPDQASFNCRLCYLICMGVHYWFSCMDQQRIRVIAYVISLLLLHETLPSFLIYWHCFLQYFKAKYEKSLINFYDMLNISSVYQAPVKRGWELMWALVRLTDNLWSTQMWLDLFLFDRGIIELGKLWCMQTLACQPKSSSLILLWPSFNFEITPFV
jgi:hypothetical protein